MMKNFDDWKISYGIFLDGARNWRQICPLVVLKGALGHTEKIQTGISAHGYARIVLDEIVDVVKSSEQKQLQQQHQLLLSHSTSGIEAIAPVLVAVAFAAGDATAVMPKSKLAWNIFHLISLPTNRFIPREFIVRIFFGGCSVLVDFGLFDYFS